MNLFGDAHVTVVSQDYMCEPFMLKKTGLDIATHQRLTIERYDVIRAVLAVPIMAVVQGYDPSDYRRSLPYSDMLDLSRSS
jgi:hypothetical protein